MKSLAYSLFFRVVGLSKFRLSLRSWKKWTENPVDLKRIAGRGSATVLDRKGKFSTFQHATGRDLAKRDYWRDDRDRIVAWKRGVDTYYNGMENGRGNRYGYDEEGQLTSASYRALNPETGTPSGAMRTDSFSYDELGNRQGQAHVANRGQWMKMVRRDNGLNQYLSWSNDPEHPVPDPQHWGSATYYDDNLGFFPWLFPGNGVMMADGYITASYNALNQPVGILVPSYGSNVMWFGFDPLGRCVKRWKGPAATGTPGYTAADYFYYDGWNLVQEGTNTTTADRTYVHGGRVDEILGSQVGGVWYYHYYDAQGNCILLTNVNGGLTEQFDYDAFGYPYFYTATGNKLGATNLHTRFLFTGREWISDLRIYDYRARLYQPELGRFLQPDPKQFDAGDYNLYRYCHNDPVNKSDPTGLDIRIDPNLTELQQIQTVSILLGAAAESASAKANIQTMINSDRTVTVGIYPPGIAGAPPLTGETLSNAAFGVTDDKVGSDAKMTLQSNSIEHTRADGTKEVVSPAAQAAHETGHGAGIVTGTQAPAREFLNPIGKDYINQPSEKDAVKAEDEARNFEGLLPRDN